MDVEEKQAFDEYFKEKYPELYKDVFNEDGDERAIIGYSFALSAWQAAKAQAVPELTDKMIVAIESEVESQLKASAIDADPFRLDGEKIWYAALEPREST